MSRLNADAAAIREVQRQRPAEAYRFFLKWRARHFLPSNAAWFAKAQVLADAGEADGALRALEQSVAAREPLAVKIGSTPSFASLRADPRFRRLTASVGV